MLAVVVPYKQSVKTAGLTTEQQSVNLSFSTDNAP